MPSASEIRSVDRLSQILACLTRDVPEMSLADFARQLGWSKATVHRYLSALHRGGLLSYDEDRLIYSIGPEIVRLSSILLRSNSLSDLAAPIIRELAQETGLTATLSVWLDTWPVVVRCESSPSRLGHWELPVGSPIPPPSAAGQIYAAFDESGQGRYHQGVAADIAAVRAAGVAFQDNLHDGVRAAAVPICDPPHVLAALSLIGPAATVPADPDHPAVLRLRDAATAIAAKVGVGQPDAAPQ